ncbi:hypothetical protein AB0O76_39810 [Streptomyces sp. NPDC086554]|uniref:hypothetical protein n=1 Tax=Streptomyces sp. NPDC086554 TaxID=3154864 RepID=UPI003435DE75
MSIDLRKAAETARELLAALEELGGATPDETPTRAGRRERADVTRKLLYLSHLGNRASVEIMDTYHAFKLREDRAGEWRAATGNERSGEPGD